MGRRRYGVRTRYHGGTIRGTARCCHMPGLLLSVCPYSLHHHARAVAERQVGYSPRKGSAQGQRTAQRLRGGPPPRPGRRRPVKVATAPPAAEATQKSSRPQAFHVPRLPGAPRAQDPRCAALAVPRAVVRALYRRECAAGAVGGRPERRRCRRRFLTSGPIPTPRTSRRLSSKP